MPVQRILGKIWQLFCTKSRNIFSYVFQCSVQKTGHWHLISPFRNSCDMVFECKCVVYKNFQVLLAFWFGHFFKVYPGLVRACSRSLLSHCGRVLHRAAINLTGQTVSPGMSFMKITKKGLTQIRLPVVSLSQHWPSLIWPHSQYVFAYVSRNDSMEKDRLQWRQMTAVIFTTRLRVTALGWPTMKCIKIQLRRFIHHN